MVTDFQVTVFDANDACAFGLLKWMTLPSFLIMFTSSIPGMVFTDNFFNDDCNFLSSVAGVLCTTFFLRRGVPLPPMRTCSCSFFNFSVFMLTNLLRCNLKFKTNCLLPLRTHQLRYTKTRATQQSFWLWIYELAVNVNAPCCSRYLFCFSTTENKVWGSGTGGQSNFGRKSYRLFTASLFPLAHGES